MSLKEKTIDKSIPVPLYYQLKQHLHEYIRNCHVGDAIPTETQLCDHFEVSRPTVRQAIAELVTEGFLTRSKGKGTFVTKPKVSRDFLLALQSFNQEMLDTGRTPSTRVLDLSTTAADDAIAGKLQITPGDPVFFLRRLRSADGKPIMVVNSFLPAARVPGFDSHDFTRVGLHWLLINTYKLDLTQAVRSFEAVAVPATEATLLDIKPGHPGQFVESLYFTQDDTPIEFSIAWYRGDYSRFTFELRASDMLHTSNMNGR